MVPIGTAVAWAAGIGAGAIWAGAAIGAGAGAAIGAGLGAIWTGLGAALGAAICPSWSRETAVAAVATSARMNDLYIMELL